MIWIGGWGMEESPSSRAKCGYCYKKIPLGELRIAMPQGRWNTLGFFHYDCWHERALRTMNYHSMGYKRAEEAHDDYTEKIIHDRIREITREAKSKKLRIGP